MSEDSANKPLLEIVKNTKKPTGTKTGNSGGSGGNGSSKTQKFGEYVVKNGAFHQVKTVKAGPDGSSGVIEFPLCDFTCRIVEEVTQDDSLADTTFLRIEGRRANGALLPLVDVPAKSFYASQGNWANEYWGTLPFIYPGAAKKDNLRACIHLFSQLNGDVPRRQVFRFTGWKKIDDT